MTFCPCQAPRQGDAPFTGKILVSGGAQGRAMDLASPGTREFPARLLAQCQAKSLGMLLCSSKMHILICMSAPIVGPGSLESR